MGIASFFRNVIDFIKTIVGIFTRPLEFIMMIIGGVIISILFVLYKILTFQPIIWLPFIVWFLVMKVVVLIIYTIVICCIILILAFVLFIIAVINAMTKGKLSKLVLCQNSPSSWYQTPNFHLGNKFERSLFCKTTCGTGYTPDELTGQYCTALPSGQPSFCPQAEVMRIFTSFNRNDSTHVYPNFNPFMNPMFNLLTPQEKEAEYKRHFMQKKRFLDTCKNTLGNYEPMILDVCSYLDMLKASKHNRLSAGDIQKLEQVCQQGFCNSKSRFFFCGKFDESKNVAAQGRSKAELVKNIVMLMILALVFMFILVFTYQFVGAV